MYVPWTTFLRLLICLHENKKRLWCLISYFDIGELTDVIKYKNKHSHSQVELPKSELPRTQVRTLRTSYWETARERSLPLGRDAINAQLCFCAEPEANNSSDTDTAAKNIRIKYLNRKESNKRLFTAGLFLWETVVFANQYPGIVSVTLYEPT